MKSTVKCIYSYYETLLGIWNTWNDGILYGHFPNGASNFTDALGINTSDGRTRAKEIYRIGLLKRELTKGTNGLDYITEGNNIQSDLGYVSALISKAAKVKRNSVIDKALSSLCAIYSIIQPVTIDDIEFSINTLIQRFNEIYPCPSNIDFRKWHRYILSAFFCEINYREDIHNTAEEKSKDSEEFVNFITRQGKCPSMTIRTNKKNGYQVRKTIKSTDDINNAVADNVSLTNIIQQKSPLFILGDERDGNPKGFYGMGMKHHAKFLHCCYKIEEQDIRNSPFSSFYNEDVNSGEKGNILKGLEQIFEHQNNEVKSEYKQLMKTIYDGAIEALGILNYHPQRTKLCQNSQSHIHYLNYLTALRTKPFMILAGISGTGKSRIVRKFAQATITEELQRTNGYTGDDFANDRWTLHCPANFELIQVKPNWHNSMDVIGYLSNIPSPHYVFTPFTEFIIKAWQYPEVPFFLCLDEMNLAPVEEYFAEFLSAIESRSFEDNEYMTDPIIKPFNSFGEDVAKMMVNTLFPNFTAADKNSFLGKIVDHLETKGMTLPKNLIVIGTVNMDETTFSFSRKVLDRAMSVEMNVVNYDSFLTDTTDDDLKAIVKALEENDDADLNTLLVDRHIEAKEIIEELGEDAQFAIDYLKRINALLEGTPFKLGYRAANEALIYLQASHEFGQTDRIAALDNFTQMKILSLIEGDETKLKITDSEADKERIANASVNVDAAKQYGDLNILTALRNIITQMLGESDNADLESNVTEETATESGKEMISTEQQKKKKELQSIKKIDSMLSQLKRDHFVSFWN